MERSFEGEEARMSICPMCKFEILKCPNCGYATTFFPRHAPRGSGAHYSHRIMKLNRSHELALEVLKTQHATNYESGLTLSQVWLRAREICNDKKIRWPTKQGLSGRLSELTGLGMVKTQGHVQLVDPESYQFRAEHQPRWFLAEQTGVYGTE